MTTLELTLYPIGHPIRWRRGIVERVGTQHGVLASDWLEHSAAWVLWEGESVVRSELPECIEPVVRLAQEHKTAPVAVSTTSMWDNYRPVARRRAR
jgi:hypothetical protein